MVFLPLLIVFFVIASCHVVMFSSVGDMQHKLVGFVGMCLENHFGIPERGKATLSWWFPSDAKMRKATSRNIIFKKDNP